MKEIVIKICGIDCAACVDRLNRTLGETEGVLEAAVNYAAGSAYLRYDEEKLGIPQKDQRFVRTGIQRQTLK